MLSDRVGTYKSMGAYDIFVAKNLPPDPPLDLDAEALQLLSKAERGLGKLDGLISIIPSPHFYMAWYNRKEALLSTQIEGTQASLVDVLTSEQGQGKVTGDVREVLNYIYALGHGLRVVRERPFSVNLLKEIHQILLAGTRGQNRDPGEFRKIQNWIGPPGGSMAEAEFVPPTAAQVPNLMSNLQEYYHYGDEPPLVKSALLHAQFETIHPFLDGNGRIGRLLITFFLCDQGLLSQPVLYLSEHFKKNRSAYYEKLMRIRNNGEWEEWIKFFLQGVVSVSERAREMARDLIDLQHEQKQTIQGITGSNKALALYDFVLERTIVDASIVAQKLNVSSATAYNLIKKLELADILSEITGQTRGRRWMHRRLMDIVAQGTYTP